MDSATVLRLYQAAASPLLFAALAALAIFLLWMAFAPARPAQQVDGRLDHYLERAAVDDEMARPFGARVLAPAVRRVARALGRFAPKRNAEMTRQMLLHAGEPLGLQVIDFFGLRLLSAVALGCAAVLLWSRRDPGMAPIVTVAAAAIGYILPVWWLKSVAGSRQHAIRRALPDALDMLTIAVEAGLAFDSAMVRVGEKWDNPLTRQFRRAVAEMRVGTPRDEALKRMADRCGVEDLSTFVAVLVQSSQLGVSIAQVLHSQAAEMRLKRRQRAEELARQAGVKMVFPLAFCVFPAMFVVIFGPVAPDMMAALQGIASSMGGAPVR